MANPRILKTDGKDKPMQVSAADFDIARHNAVVTIEHDGDHRTFMIRTVMPGEKFGKPGRRLVSLLTGPDRDNPRNWYSFGFVQPGGVITMFDNCIGKTYKDNGQRKLSPYEYYARMLMNPPKWEADGYAYLLMTFCHHCNRPLTHPESIKSGLGPVCRGKAA